MIKMMMDRAAVAATNPLLLSSVQNNKIVKRFMELKVDSNS